MLDIGRIISTLYLGGLKTLETSLSLGRKKHLEAVSELTGTADSSVEHLTLDVSDVDKDVGPTVESLLRDSRTISKHTIIQTLTIVIDEISPTATQVVKSILSQVNSTALHTVTFIFDEAGPGDLNRFKPKRVQALLTSSLFQGLTTVEFRVRAWPDNCEKLKKILPDKFPLLTAMNYLRVVVEAI